MLIEKCKDSGQKVILLPTSDFSAVAIDESKNLLLDHFLFPRVAVGSVRDWMDKGLQKARAREIGLNVPDAHIINISNGIYEIPEDIAYPCFTKPLVTIVGGKKCFNRCDNYEELQKALDHIGARQDARILVEDFKEIEKEYAVVGFSDGENVVIPGVIHLMSQTASHFGVAMTGTIDPIIGLRPLIEQMKEFVRRVGFIGLFDIDFYYSENLYWFGEMNLRFGGSGYAATRSGVNLPAMLIRAFRGESYSGMKQQIEKSSSFVNERMCEDDWYQGVISLKQYRHILSSADISFVRDAQDPKPEKIFALMHYIRPIKKYLRKIIAHQN